MNNFFQDLGRGLFTLDLSQLFQSDYLTNSNPGEFGLYAWAYLIAFLGLGVSGYAIWYFKKRRKRLELEVGQRRFARRHALVSTVIFSAYLIYVVLRSSEVELVSVRLVGYMLLLLAAINAAVAVYLVRKEEPAAESSAESETTIAYGRYLPRKKRK